MDTFDDLLAHKSKVGVIGLGYVGFPLASIFAKKFKVIGFDIDKKKVEKFKLGEDVTQEVGSVDSSIHFTTNPAELAQCSVLVVCVPTPTLLDHKPDLKPLKGATKLVADYAAPNTVIIYESTVYPGVTEELAQEFFPERLGKDLFIGYSPERINPGDKVNRVENITKLVSGMNAEITDIVTKLYASVIKEVHVCSSIKVAEMSKLFENTQRDVNIALANELGLVCDALGISTYDVLKAAGTKWNFTKVQPGFVGGHCIAEDPYYYIDLAKKHNAPYQIVESARRLNATMPKIIGEKVLKDLAADGKKKKYNVAILGAAFKENVNDFRNTGSVLLYEYLDQFKLVNVFIVDPLVDSDDFFGEYGIELTAFASLSKLDVVVLAVNHKAFAPILNSLESSLDAKGPRLVYDIKGAIKNLGNFKVWNF